DVVADFITFVPAQAERNLRLFSGKTGQYIFISTASAYQKPQIAEGITESTPLANPYWEYSRNKAAIEALLLEENRKSGFPATIVRPSHTYGNKSLPVALHGDKGSYQVLERMLLGKPVIVPGDGTSWWTLTHNTDFAKAFVGLMGNAHSIGQAYHITSDEQLTWDMIHDIIGKIIGKEPKLVHVSAEMLAKIRPDWLGPLVGDKCASVRFDNSKIKKAVPGFAATLRFDQGARLAIDYILSHPECQVKDPAFDVLSEKVIEKALNFAI
ncbi:MAG: NAD-dependent epimerase/dehydratase family protein, partial [Clostridiales bacterium]|nr:NAD-dependent epimerase/dehydratase family protein [Clostridiales bacterium]